MPIYKMNGKKDGLQKYRVRINYTDNSGTSRQIDRVAYGLDEAKVLEWKLTQSIKDKDAIRRITIQQLYDEYIAFKKHEVRESSLDKSKRILNRYVLPTFGPIKLNQIKTSALQKWKLEMSDLALSLKTRKNIFGEFRALLNHAIKMEYLSRNPLEKVGNFKATLADQKEMKYYTPDEFKAFIAAARQAAVQYELEKNSVYEWNYYVFFTIAFYTGLRKGEIHGLQWNDIKGEYLSVKRSVAQKIKGPDRVTPPKNKSSIRTLQIPKPLQSILQQHYDRFKQIPGFSDTFCVCGGERPIRDTSIQNRNKQYAAMAGIKMIRVHDFRHSHASLLANEGINIQEIARRLGHSKIEITWNTYSHLYPREQERAVQILNKIV